MQIDPPQKLVAAGGSPGGIAAPKAPAAGVQVASLAAQAIIAPADLPAAVLIVLHMTTHHESMLTRILARRTSLTAKEAQDGEALRRSVVFVAPADTHLLVSADGTSHLGKSELMHYVRPSADVLLLSLAREYPGRCLAVVLSGTGVDGAAGAAAVKQAGGHVVAQNEATSQHFGMPGAAILAGGVDQVLPLSRIGGAVNDFTVVEA